ncbi:MAG: electron transfer flavoprotein subunit beta/FixA family protein [Deltaproteobacteria bacterium]|nr:electron transfer flavoprotein subunit beta/FixA family protein [Deltaproteobacteria bacterium]
MLKIIVCIKQVPGVSELPWDSKTGTLKRDMAEGMMNPACKHALEAALEIKHQHGAHITTLSMGPPMAEEILRESLAMGADRGILLTDPRMAGADTLITSHTLARAIIRECPDFDLILCGCHTSDSETAQVGPQLGEELDIAAVAYVERIEIIGRRVSMQRESDDFLETLEMDMPGLITVTTTGYPPRYAPMSGLQDAFETGEILYRNMDHLGLESGAVGMKASPTRILDVYSPMARKRNIVLKGSAKKSAENLFDQFGDKLSGAMAKDLKTHDHGRNDDEREDE